MDLERLTRRDPSRFKYEAKGGRTGRENQGNIYAKKKKKGDQSNGSRQKKIKLNLRKIKYQRIT